MSVMQTIANNLSAWMANTPSLDTLKKVALRSGVGFGTVQRVKNGDGNPTVTNLEDIAKAFGKRLQDLIEPITYTEGQDATTLAVREPPTPMAYEPPLRDIIEAAHRMSRDGQHILLGRAQELALTYPAAAIPATKTKRSS